MSRVLTWDTQTHTHSVTYTQERGVTAEKGKGEDHFSIYGKKQKAESLYKFTLKVRNL